MNSIHRLGLTIASVVAVATVGATFVVQGYVAAAQTVQASAQPTAQATASLVPEIVYLSPVAAAPTAAPTQQPPVIHVVVPGHGDEEGGSDD